MNDEDVCRTAPATPGLFKKIPHTGDKASLDDADSSTDAIGGWTKAKSAKKKLFFLRGNLRPLPNKNFQMLDHFFPLLFPKDSESLKILDIRL